MSDNTFSFSATETGYNHLKINKVCEDSSGFYDDESMHICVVADGHGSDNYPRTDRGSKLAVEAAIKCCKDFVGIADPKDVLEDENNNYDLLMQLAKSILREWHQAVEEDYKEYPFIEDELVNVSEKYKTKYLSDNEDERNVQKAYGCTLILFVETKGYSFGMQIGDAKSVAIDEDGESIEPIPWDENCQLNVTTSICDSDAIEEFRYFVSKDSPVAVFCGSDGIDDSYANPDELYALYRSILKIFIEHGREVGQNEIKEYLPVLTKKGSGDDVSIATIVDAQRLKQMAAILDLRAELFKKVEEEKEVNHSADVLAEQRSNLMKKVQSIATNILDVPDDAIIKLKQLEQEVKDKEARLSEIELEKKDIENQIYGINKEKASDLVKDNKLVGENNNKTEESVELSGAAVKTKPKKKSTESNKQQKEPVVDNVSTDVRVMPSTTTQLSGTFNNILKASPQNVVQNEKESIAIEKDSDNCQKDK